MFLFQRVCLLCALLLPFSLLANVPSVASGSIQRIEHFQSEFVPARHVDVWLPDTYNHSQPHKVLFMHDGQMLFDKTQTWNKQAWEVDDVISDMLRKKQIPPLIVVAIHNGGELRHSEYFPQKPFESLSHHHQTRLYTLERHANTPLFSKDVYSDNYLKFIVKELIPYIEANFNVGQTQADRFVMGSSMGGLISLYALMEYPSVFQGAACLSTHWPGVFDSKNNPVPAVFMDYIKEKLPVIQSQKLYFDHGTATLDAMYPNLQKQVDTILKTRGFTDANWMTQVFEGAAHTEDAWSERLSIPLQFLFTP